MSEQSAAHYPPIRATTGGPDVTPARIAAPPRRVSRAWRIGTVVVFLLAGVLMGTARAYSHGEDIRDRSIDLSALVEGAGGRVASAESKAAVMQHQIDALAGSDVSPEVTKALAVGAALESAAGLTAVTGPALARFTGGRPTRLGRQLPDDCRSGRSGGAPAGRAVGGECPVGRRRGGDDDHGSAGGDHLGRAVHRQHAAAAGPGVLAAVRDHRDRRRQEDGGARSTPSPAWPCSKRTCRSSSWASKSIPLPMQHFPPMRGSSE